MLTDNINWLVLYSCTLTVHKNCSAKVKTEKKCCYRSMEGHRLWVKHKQNWGQKFIVLLPQASALPGSDAAGSDGFETASGFVIKNQRPCTPSHVQSRLWDTLLKRGLQFVQRQRFCLKSAKEARLHCTWTNGIAQHQSAED